MTSPWKVLPIRPRLRPDQVESPCPRAGMFVTPHSPVALIEPEVSALRRIDEERMQSFPGWLAICGRCGQLYFLQHDEEESDNANP